MDFESHRHLRSLLDSEIRPTLLFASHDRDAVFFPGDDSRFDSIVVTEGRTHFQWVSKIEQHVYSLFFDAKGGDFSESGWLNAADPGVERLVATPLLQISVGARMNLHGIARK